MNTETTGLFNDQLARAEGIAPGPEGGDEPWVLQQLRRRDEYLAYLEARGEAPVTSELRRSERWGAALHEAVKSLMPSRTGLDTRVQVAVRGAVAAGRPEVRVIGPGHRHAITDALDVIGERIRDPRLVLVIKGCPASSRSRAGPRRWSTPPSRRASRPRRTPTTGTPSTSRGRPRGGRRGRAEPPRPGRGLRSPLRA